LIEKLFGGFGAFSALASGDIEKTIANEIIDNTRNFFVCKIYRMFLQL
jgi:hypothetical protein